MEQFFNEVYEWQVRTFGKADGTGKCHHALQEIKEIHLAILTGEKEEVKKELADLFILAIGIAGSNYITWPELFTAMIEKMEVNKKRAWGKPDENGVVNHIK